MAIIGDLVTRFTADMTGLKEGIAQYGREIGQAEKANKDFNKGLDAIIGSTLKWLGLVVAVGYAAYKSIQHYGQVAQSLKDLSYQTGISTSKLQDLKYAAMLSGVDFNKVAGSLNDISLSIEKASDKTSDAYKAFAKLGVSVDGKTPDRVFEDVAVALSNIEDPIQRATISNTLLGRSWKEMIPFVDAYNSKREEIKKASKYTVDEIENMQNLKTSIDTTANALDTYYGKVIAWLGKINEANKELNPNTSYLDQWLQSYGPKKGAPGAGGRAGDYTPPAEKVVLGGADPFAGLTAKEAEIRYLTDVTIPALQTKLDDLMKSGTTDEIATASLALLEAKQQLLDVELAKQEEINDAAREYLRVLEDIDDLNRKDALTRQEYLMDVSAAGRDVSQIRSLTLGFNKSMLRSADARQELAGDLSNTFNTFNQVTNSQAGDTTTTINNSFGPINLSKDYPLEKFIKDYEAYVKKNRLQQGVRA